MKRAAVCVFMLLAGALPVLPHILPAWSYETTPEVTAQPGQIYRLRQW